MIDPPPVIHQVRPMSTSLCQEQLGTGWQLLDPRLEASSKAYWTKNLAGKIGQGEAVHPVCGYPIQCTLPALTGRIGPNGPWLTGTKINIGAENNLRSLNYYNPKDCLSLTEVTYLEDSRKPSERCIYQRYHQGFPNFYQSGTPTWINNPTRAINTEPPDFDLTSYIKHLDNCR